MDNGPDSSLQTPLQNQWTPQTPFPRFPVAPSGLRLVRSRGLETLLPQARCETRAFGEWSVDEQKQLSVQGARNIFES